MTFLPIVDRELRIAARLTSTYKKRALTAAIVSAVAIVMLIFGATVSTPSQVGAAMFGTLSYLTLIFCLLEGARITADCLSEERREGTLGLLFLTDLKGYDIVLGKLAATSLTSIYGLLAILPILALCLLLGGVTQGEFWRRALALTNILFFSLSAGIWVSARSRVERRAMVGTVLLILTCLLVPPLVGLGFLSPFHAFQAAPDVLYHGGTANFWGSVLCTQLLSWLLLAWASFAISHLQQDAVVHTNPSPLSVRWNGGQFEKERSDALRANLLDLNPAAWLAARGTGQQIFGCLFIALATVATLTFLLLPGVEFFPAYIGSMLLLNFMLKIRVASQACHYLAEARSNNALEMLLCTPLTIEKMIDGQLIALKEIFRRPIISLILIELLGIFGGVLKSSTGFDRIPYAFLALIPGILYFLIFILDLLAVSWAGAWFGLSSKNESQAIFKNIFYVLVLPLLLSIFYCLAIPIFIAWPIIYIAWAKQKVRSNFRALIGQRFDSVSEPSGWWPFTKANYTRPPTLNPESFPTQPTDLPHPIVPEQK
jgi:hypothetical protein